MQLLWIHLLSDLYSRTKNTLAISIKQKTITKPRFLTIFVVFIPPISSNLDFEELSPSSSEGKLIPRSFSNILSAGISLNETRSIIDVQKN